MGSFSLLIIKWYRQNQRNLPWRSTKDPYKIWLSEIILQQTRVDQGLPYYIKFINNYPTITDLANAEEQEILKLWQGLGYYSRARNLHQAAKQIVERYDGIFPSTYAEIRSLKGVGDYTAAAIASFAFQLPYPVLDGNVFRVLSRFFNDATPIDTGKGKKHFLEYLTTLIDKNNPADFNQGIMELGALVCTPKNPDCKSCPLAENCLANRKKTIEKLPFKSKKVKIRVRYFNYLVCPLHLQLEQRLEKDIWQNLFQLPLLETNVPQNKTVLEKAVSKKFDCRIVSKINEIEHKLTHQKIKAVFWEIDRPIENNNFITTDLLGLEAYPLSRLIDLFIEKHTQLFC